MPRAYIDDRTKRFPSRKRAAPKYLIAENWRSGIEGCASNASLKLLSVTYQSAGEQIIADEAEDEDYHGEEVAPIVLILEQIGQRSVIPLYINPSSRGTHHFERQSSRIWD
jgi:hypothetical protein